MGERSMKTAIFVSLTSLLIFGLVSCGSQSDSPPSTQTSSSAVFVNNTSSRNYFPSSIGNTWKYVSGTNSSDYRTYTIVKLTSE
jgi:hypothetical protein